MAIAVPLIGLAAIYLTAVLPLRRGQKDIAKRVGTPNGNGDLSEVGGKIIKALEGHGRRLDVLEAAFHDQKRELTAYVKQDGEAHDTLRELIEAQNVHTEQRELAEEAAPSPG